MIITQFFFKVYIEIWIGYGMQNVNKSTYDILLFGVRTNVFIQMITAHEFFTAFRALEALFTGMGSTMTLQFIRSRKTFTTEYPWTCKWSFTWNWYNFGILLILNIFEEKKASNYYTNQCASVNVLEDVMFYRKLYYNQECDKYAVACDQHDVHLLYNLGMCKRLVSNVVLPHHHHLHSSLWWLWFEFVEWLLPLLLFDL